VDYLGAMDSVDARGRGMGLRSRQFLGEVSRMLLRLAAILFTLALAAPAALPPKPTDYAGTVVAVNEKAITVQGKIGTRVFQIYPGTIFGKGNRQKLADFKPGSNVIVVFSEMGGISKAENIRTPEPPKPKKAAAKKPTEKPADKKAKPKP
jgi:hypothetical protein